MNAPFYRHSEACNAQAWVAVIILVLLPQRAGAEWRNQRELLQPPFEHFNGATGKKWFTETTGSGVAWIDFDLDGDLDLYLINGASPQWEKTEKTHSNALYVNTAGRFDLAKGVMADRGNGMGVCIGDVNADGFADVLVTNFGEDKLYINQIGDEFIDATKDSGISGKAWSTGCAFADVDADGDHDLYIAHYVQFNQFNRHQCTIPGTDAPSICPPSVYSGAMDTLYINDGEGHFENQSRARGLIDNPEQRGFGVVIADLDNDDDLDIYVANDGGMNSYYVNDGTGHFEDQSLFSGLGFDATGKAQAGMGVDMGDWNGDGWFDLLVSNFALEPNNLFQNTDKGYFEEISRETGLFKHSHRSVWWGIAWADLDLDADLDIVLAAGHVEPDINGMVPSMHYPQENLMLYNEEPARFVPQPFPSQKAAVSRGLAIGDFDNNGRPDIVINNANSAPDIWVNPVLAGHWLGITLVNSPGKPVPLNAKMSLKTPNRIQWRSIHSGGSFLSQHDLRSLFGFRDLPAQAFLTIHWPDGLVQNISVMEFDRYIAVNRP